MQKLVLNARSEVSGFAGKDGELFWSIGAPQLGIWECGLRNSQVVFEFHLCIFNPKSEIHNPKCDDSSRLPQEGKENSNPLRRLPEDGSFGPGFFTFGGLQ